MQKLIEYLVIPLCVSFVIGVFAYLAINEGKKSTWRANWYAENGYVTYNHPQMGSIIVRSEDLVKLKIDAAKLEK